MHVVTAVHYVADDGSRWDNLGDAMGREQLNRSLTAVWRLLGYPPDTSTEAGQRFLKGEAYVQHGANFVREVHRQLLDLTKPFTHPREPDVSSSELSRYGLPWYEKMLRGKPVAEPLLDSWYRYFRIDNLSREWFCFDYRKGHRCSTPIQVHSVAG